MTFYATFDYSAVNTAAQALQAQYGSRVNVSVITQPASGTSYVLQVDTNDSTITADDISSTITNAIGSYANVTGGSSTTPASGIDMGAFLNSIGAQLRALWNKLTSAFPSWLSIVLIILLILFLVIFFAQFGKGLGEGTAERI